MTIKAGITKQITKVVSAQDTATAFGSGVVEVFATPAMIALIEETALKSVEPFLDDDQTGKGGQGLIFEFDFRQTMNCLFDFRSAILHEEPLSVMVVFVILNHNSRGSICQVLRPPRITLIGCRKTWASLWVSKKHPRPHFTGG